jgi:hypothetical protein
MPAWKCGGRSAPVAERSTSLWLSRCRAKQGCCRPLDRGPHSGVVEELYRLRFVATDQAKSGPIIDVRIRLQDCSRNIKRPVAEAPFGLLVFFRRHDVCYEPCLDRLMQDFAQGKRRPPLHRGDPLPTAGLAISRILEDYATEILRTN